MSGTAFGFLGERVNRQTVIYLRRYYRVSALPTYWTSTLLYKYGGGGNGQLGGTHNGSFAVGGTAQQHKFTLINNNTPTTTSSSSVPVNAWFRVEVRLSFGAGSGTQTVRLYLGANLNGTPPSETLSGPLTGSYTDYSRGRHPDQPRHELRRPNRRSRQPRLLAGPGHLTTGTLADDALLYSARPPLVLEMFPPFEGPTTRMRSPPSTPPYSYLAGSGPAAWGSSQACTLTVVTSRSKKPSRSSATGSFRRLVGRRRVDGLVGASQKAACLPRVTRDDRALEDASADRGQ